MKTLSISEFKKLVERDDWTRKQDHEEINRITREDAVLEDDAVYPDHVEITHVFGWASKTSTLGDITITYSEGFNYDEYQSDTLTYGTEGQDEVWLIEGIEVIDDDGDEVDAHDLADYLTSDFSAIDYDVLNIDQTTDIDFDEDSDMETFTLEIDNAPSLRFTGELLGSASSSDNNASGSRYSGQTGRWTELALYKSKGGKFICHQVGRTRWEGERDRYSGKVCETQDEVKEFFGNRWLAKELYFEAGIDNVIDID